MRSKLVQIGNSYGVRLTREMLARAGITAGQPIELRIEKRRITIRPDAPGLADQARLQSIRASAASDRQELAWEDDADGEGWR